MIAESFLATETDPSRFIDFVNVELVSAGISRFLGDGKLRTVVEALGKIEEMGIRPSSLLDGSAKESLARECRKLVDGGRIEEFVALMESLAGYGFSVKEFVEPFAILKICVKKRDPHMAVRYANIFPHAPILFCSIIQEFGKKQDLVSALIVFEASKWKSDGPNMYVCRSIIDTCGLCGDFLRARCIFEELLAHNITPNIYVFNSLMNVNGHDLSYTLHVYNHMQTLGVAADVASYNILLKACCLAGRVDLAQDIYKEVQHVASTGALKMDIITYSTTIKVFADAKMWQMALKVKDDMLCAGVNPNIVTWSSLISAFANAGLVEQAVNVFEEMLLAGCKPNTQCCNILLYACVVGCQYDRAFRFFRSWVKSGFPNTRGCGGNIYAQLRAKNTGNSGATCVSHHIIDPHQVSFSKVVPFRPTVATYNILMKACGTDFWRAKALMDEMRMLGLYPNHRSWSILIDICGKAHNVQGAMQAFQNMRNAGITPDVVAYTTAIKACVENKSLKMAFLLFEEMKRYLIQPNLVTYNTLLRARSRYGSLQEVRQCLAIYQDMRKAGYSSNDYFLKELLEEWCEGVIKNSELGPVQMTYPSCSSGKAKTDKPQSLLLEKIAVLLQKDFVKGSSVDLRGLSKVEARIVVLAVLRMIKETYNQGKPIEDDLIIFTGVGTGSGCSESEVQGALIKVLRDELNLNVSAQPGITLCTNDLLSSANAHQSHEKKSNLQIHFESLPRKPRVLGRLVVSRESLHSWLQKRVGLTWQASGGAHR